MHAYGHRRAHLQRTHTHRHQDTHARTHERMKSCVEACPYPFACGTGAVCARTQVSGCTLYAHVQELMKAFSMNPEAILAHASSAFDATAQKLKDKPVLVCLCMFSACYLVCEQA